MFTTISANSVFMTNNGIDHAISRVRKNQNMRMAKPTRATNYAEQEDSSSTSKTTTRRTAMNTAFVTAAAAMLISQSNDTAHAKAKEEKKDDTSFSAVQGKKDSNKAAILAAARAKAEGNAQKSAAGQSNSLKSADMRDMTQSGAGERGAPGASVTY